MGMFISQDKAVVRLKSGNEPEVGVIPPLTPSFPLHLPVNLQTRTLASPRCVFVCLLVYCFLLNQTAARADAYLIHHKTCPLPSTWSRPPQTGSWVGGHGEGASSHSAHLTLQKCQLELEIPWKKAN